MAGRSDLRIASFMPLAGEAVDDEVLSLHVAEPPQLHEELAKEQIRARFGHKGDGRCRGDHGNPIRLTPLPDAVPLAAVLEHASGAAKRTAPVPARNLRRSTTELPHPPAPATTANRQAEGLGGLR